MSTAVALADTDWHTDALNVIEAFATSGLKFTAEDLTRSIRPAPNPNDVGNVFQSARRAGLITCVGFRESSTPSRKGGVIRIWMKAREQ